MDILRIGVAKVTARRETRVMISSELLVKLQSCSEYVLELTIRYSR